MNKDKYLKLIKDTILFSSDCNSMKEAIDFFESRRHLPSSYKTQEFFDELVISQLAILFKILIDGGEVVVKNNVIKLKSILSKLEDDEVRK